jgi:hypothetical protein
MRIGAAFNPIRESAMSNNRTEAGDGSTNTATPKQTEDQQQQKSNETGLQGSRHSQTGQQQAASGGATQGPGKHRRSDCKG